MACPSCGADNPTEDRFCGQCGSALPAPCAACGRANPASNRFCGGCGAPLGDAAPTSDSDPEHLAVMPGDRIPRHLAEKILANRAALEGERKQVTVLFADIVGSTELIRDRDPEEAQALLDGEITRMMAAVHRYEGTVSRLMGDGLMAMFGAPIAHEDHAVRACYAALAMLEAAREFADEARRAHGVAIQIRVGINSGEVVVRLISDDLHMDYTAMGQTVHLASRVEGLASAGTALLSPSTLALAEGFIDARPLGPTTVKGLEHPVEVYELTGAGAARTRLQAAAARGLTPFVGRQEERAAIDRALARVRAGHGQAVALVAEAGVGKSRLVWEATRSDHADGFRLLQTGAVSYGQATAWLPISDLLRTYFHIESRDDHAAMRAKVIGGMQALDPTLAPDLPALLWLLDLPVDDDAWTALDPPRRRAATLDALRRLLLRESQRQPLLLVFEDLHWIDSETQALLDSLVEAIPTACILLLVNYRPEYTHAWGNKSYYTQLRIDPLGQASADALLTALLGDDASVEPLKALLIARTDGNPFFLEESVRALVETGALAGEQGAYRLTRPVEDIRIPATVQAVLAARIDRLPPEEKHLLQTASVIGKDVPFALLQALSDPSDGDLRANVSRLQAAELLYPVSLHPEPEYTFKHALTHEVTYGGLLQERRRTLHARLMEAIEDLYSDRLDEHMERLAHHAVHGRIWAAALRYCRRAGQKANQRYAHREAGRYYEQALDALQHLPRSRDTLEHAVDVRLALRGALRPLYRLERIRELLLEAEQLADELGDPTRICNVTYLLAHSYEDQREYDKALQAGYRSVAMAEEVRDDLLKVRAYGPITLVYEWTGRYQQALTCHQWRIAALARLPYVSSEGQLSTPMLQTHAQMAFCLAQLGRFDEAITYGLAALREAEAANAPDGRFGACWRLSDVYLRRGDMKRALPIIDQYTEALEALGNPYPWAPIQPGYAYALQGRIEEALAQLQLGERHAVGEFGGASRAHWFVQLGEAYLLIGQRGEAINWAAQALELAHRCDERGHLAWTLRLMGDIAANDVAARAADAEASYSEALDLGREAGMRPLQAHCHLGLGRLYRRIGRHDEAHAELATAVAMLREMGMAFWLPEAERELANVGGARPLSER